MLYKLNKFKFSFNNLSFLTFSDDIAFLDSSENDLKRVLYERRVISKGTTYQ